MRIFFDKGQDLIRVYRQSNDGVAALEAALLFPTLMLMMVSMIDIGNGLLSNQKLINAAQMTADLITRESNPTLDQRDDAIKAGLLAMSPYSTTSYEYNITSFQFDALGDANIVWQESSGIPLETALITGLSDLGNPGEGVVVVKVEYTYTPFFTGFILGPIAMQEVAYLRGRKSAVVGLPI